MAHSSQMDINEVLKSAARKDDASGVTKAIQQGADPNCMVVGILPWTVLFYAVVGNQGDIVRALLSGGAQPDKVDVKKLWQLPLVHAASNGYYDICRLLLQYGAQPDAAGILGYTALHRAVWRGYLDVVQLLVSYGADPQQSHPCECSLESAARRYKHNTLADWLKKTTKLINRIGREIGPEEIYPNRSGLVVFFNYPNVRGQKPIPGATLDEQNIKDTFGRKLGYFVECHTDFNAAETSLELEKLSGQERLWLMDTLIVIMSSHGSNNTRFVTSDNEDHDFREVRQHFSSKNCPQLANKPFILIADCCRGGEVEAEKNYLEGGMKRLSLQNRQQVVEGGKARVVAPRLANMTTIYSSSEGVTSRASKGEGSFFISALCGTLKAHPMKELSTIMNITSDSLQKKGRPHPSMAPEYPFRKFVFQIKCPSD